MSGVKGQSSRDYIIPKDLMRPTGVKQSTVILIVAGRAWNRETEIREQGLEDEKKKIPEKL